jgi:hypothetical protein
MKFLFAIFILFVWVGISCNYNLFVKNEKTINTNYGFIFCTKDEIDGFISDYFIPTQNIDTAKEFLSDFITQKKKIGFRINIDRALRNNLISQFSRTVYNEQYEKLHKLKLSDFNRGEFGNIYILPVCIEYVNKNQQKKDFGGILDTSFVFNQNKISIEYYRTKKIWVLSVLPIISDNVRMRRIN